MSLTVEEGKEIITAFCAEYPSAYQVQYKVRETQEEVLNEKATIENVGKIGGAYFPARNIAAFATANFRDRDHFEGTLKHEILGHYGLNTCTAQEKHAILDSIIASKETTGVGDLWELVKPLYPNQSDQRIAEEVFAFACEEVSANRLAAAPEGKQLLVERLFYPKPLEFTQLKSLTEYIASGLQDGTRRQQIFPEGDHLQFKKETDMDKKKPFHEVVAEKLIEQLKAGTAPWQRPWEPGVIDGLPMNPTTGNRYKGINAIQLLSEGREDNRWLTYKQASAMGAQVRKGEKGTPVQYWKFAEEQVKRDENGKPVLDADGNPEKETVKLERPRVFMATVFNAEQIDGMPPLVKREKTPAWEAHARAENILQSSGAQIFHSESNRAFYRSSTDSIHMPEKRQFDSADKYYATALHELGHWTGHASRLDRDLANPFGSAAYAKEELRAEIASMIIGQELGLGHDPGQHVAYVGSWIKALQDDPLEIFRAAADAEKIQDYVFALEKQQKLENTAEQFQTQALDYLSRHYNVSALTEDQLSFINAASHGGSSPVVAAMELAQEEGLKLSKEGLIFAVTDRLVSRQDDLRNNPAFSFLDRGTGEKPGQHTYLFSAAESDAKHLIGINFDSHTAEVLESRHKQTNELLTYQQIGSNPFVVDILTLPPATRSQAGIEELTARYDNNPDLTNLLNAVDIKEVLTHPDVTFDHFQSFKGETLEAALRDRGLNTVGSVTGSEPGAFHQTSWERLSAVFGIAPDDYATSNPYFERKGLAQRFQLKAEEIELNLKQKNQIDVAEGNTPSVSDPALDPERVAAMAKGANARIEREASQREEWHRRNEKLVESIEQRQATWQTAPRDAWSDRDVLRINDEPFVAVPYMPTRDASAYAVYDLRDGADAEAVTYLRRNEVQNWLFRAGESIVTTNSEKTDTLENEILQSILSTSEARLTRLVDNTDTDNLAAVERIANSMTPLSTTNEFWQRHELPFEVDSVEHRIFSLMDKINDRREDAEIAEAIRTKDYARMDELTNDLFNGRLPHDWTGEVRIIGVVSKLGAIHEAAPSETPAAHHLYARKGDALPGDDAFAFVTSVKSRADADMLAERLAVIDANAQPNEQEKAARLARIQEDRIRRDPTSTDEEISAAKEERKTAEFTASASEIDQVAALLADKDLQKQIREIESIASTNGESQPQITYIDVPYKEKEEAKALGAKWDRKEQSWYVPPNVDSAPFSKWLTTESKTAHENPAGAPLKSDKTFLAVPYGEIKTAKAAGALWDKAAKSWFVGPGGDMEKLQRWLPEKVAAQQSPAVTPVEEFADALRSMGCIVSGAHPIMDGKKHRIAAEGDKAGEKAGFYIGHLDDHPAGYIKNNRTGLDMKWKSKGYSLTEEEKALLNATAAAKLAARAEGLHETHLTTAARLEASLASLRPLSEGETTPYLENKGARLHKGLFTDNEGKTTFIPAQDVDGKMWTIQYIKEDGIKRFAKNSKKEGCFHVVGGMDALAAAPALVVGEGYATAETAAQALRFATVAAFDSGNLPAVVAALHEKFPEKPVIVIGDDDRHLEMTQGNNPGRAKAEAAAKQAGGKAVFPIFTSKETEYPSNLPPVTPAAFRNKELSEQQLTALDRIKSFTDFNDMATKSELGRDGVKRQLAAAVSLALKKSPAIDEENLNRIQKQEEIITKKRTAKIG